MRRLTQDIVIVAAKRTPFGAFGGSLRSSTATDLGVLAARAALEQIGAQGADIDHVVMGNVLQTSADALYLARHVGLRAGIPERVGGLTVNRLCGSGFQAVVSAAQEILTGQAATVLAGGTESMSQAPHVIRGARWGLKLGETPMADGLWEALYDPIAKLSMAQTAERLATDFGISRQEADEFAALSQSRFARAQSAGHLHVELVPVQIPGKRAPTGLDRDEHPRPDTTPASLAALKPSFGGIITAGNASGINDGAGALVLTTMAHASHKGWRPLARLVSWGITGCDPTRMGLGPVQAIRNALTMADLTLPEIDLFEVNEAFAPQYLAVEKSLELDRERTNVSGGAIAVGHPLAASGARITGHLCYELERREAHLAVGSACIGGGQGIAVVLERVTS